MIDREYVKLNTSLQTASNADTLITNAEGDIEATLELRLPQNIFAGGGVKKVDKVEMITSKFRLSMENTPIAQLPLDTTLLTPSLVPSTCKMDVYPYCLLDNNQIRPLPGDENASNAFPNYKKHIIDYKIFYVTGTDDPIMFDEYYVLCNSTGNGLPTNSRFYNAFKEAGVLNLETHIMNMCAQSNHEPYKIEGSSLFIHNIGTLEQMLQDGLENAISFASSSGTAVVNVFFYDSQNIPSSVTPKPNSSISIVSPATEFDTTLYFWKYEVDAENSTIDSGLAHACKPAIRLGEQSLSISYDSAAFKNTIPIFWNTPFINTYDQPEQMSIDKLRSHVWSEPPPKRIYKYDVVVNADTSYDYGLPMTMDCAPMNLVVNKEMKDTFSFLPWIKMDDLSNIETRVPQYTVTKSKRLTYENMMEIAGSSANYYIPCESDKIIVSTTNGLLEHKLHFGVLDFSTIPVKYGTTAEITAAMDSPLSRLYNPTNNPGLALLPQITPPYRYWLYITEEFTPTGSSSSTYKHYTAANIEVEDVRLSEEAMINCGWKAVDRSREPTMPAALTPTTTEEQINEYTTFVPVQPNEEEIKSGEHIIEANSTYSLYSYRTNLNGDGLGIGPVNTYLKKDENGNLKYYLSCGWKSLLSTNEMPDNEEVYERFYWHPGGVSRFTDINVEVSVDLRTASSTSTYKTVVTDEGTYRYSFYVAAVDILEQINGGETPYRYYTLTDETISSTASIKETYAKSWEETTTFVTDASESMQVTPFVMEPNLQDENFYILDGTTAQVQIGAQETIQTNNYNYQVKQEVGYANLEKRSCSYTTTGIPLDLSTENDPPFEKIRTSRMCGGVSSVYLYNESRALPVKSIAYTYRIATDNPDVRSNELVYAGTKCSEFIEKIGEGSVDLETIGDWESATEISPAPDPNPLDPILISSVKSNNPSLVAGTSIDALHRTDPILTNYNREATQLEGSGVARYWIINNEQYPAEHTNVLTSGWTVKTGTPPESLKTGIIEVPDSVGYQTFIIYWEVDYTTVNYIYEETPSFIITCDDYRANPATITTVTEENPQYEGNVRLTFTWNNLPMVVMSPIQSIVLTLSGVTLSQEICPINIQNIGGSSLTSTVPVVENYYSLAQTLRDLHDELVVVKDDFNDKATYTLAATSGQERVLHLSAKYITKDGTLHQIYIPKNGVYSIQLTFGITYYIS